MINENFIFLGVAINFFGTIKYVISMLKGETKPDKVTWLLWALIPMIAFAAQIKQGVGLIALPTFMAGFNPSLVFISSFVNKKAEWKLNKLDITCGILSVFGLILWQLTNTPNLAIIFAIIADGLAAFPTIVKSYTNPETENDIAYSVAAISALITLSTIKTWNFAHYSYAVYAFLVTSTIFTLIRFKIGPKTKRAFS